MTLSITCADLCASTSITLEEDPVKLYIRDIKTGLKVSSQDKYTYSFSEMYFKNIHTHGVVTELFFNDPSLFHFELSDPTNSIDVYFKAAKFQDRVPESFYEHVSENLECLRNSNGGTINPDVLKTLTWMRDEIEAASKPFSLEVGNCVSVTGNVFTDEISNVRNISAFACFKTDLIADTIWLQELDLIYKTQYTGCPSERQRTSYLLSYITNRIPQLSIVNNITSILSKLNVY